MAEAIAKRATYADLEAVPPHLVAEILRGRLVTHPRPTGRHSEVHFMLGGVLGGPFREGIGGPGGWRFLTEPELHLDDHVAVPELAGWRTERIDGPPAPDPLAPVKIMLAPDWICEILSPSTESYDRGDKREIYAEAGVQNLWLIDPRISMLEVFALRNSRWTLLATHVDAAPVRAAPFGELEFNLGRLWPPGTAPELA
ncbi:MAG: Uma2 family endonuclease [Hyphomicrobiaceae bacterium]